MVNGPTHCHVVNGPGATYNIESDGTIGNATGTFTNNGTFTKSAGTGTSAVGSFFVNDGGTIAAQSGTLALSAAASFSPTSTFLNTSTFQPASGAVIDIAGAGTAILDGTLTGSGAGQVVVNGANAPTFEIGDDTHAGATLNFPAGLFRLIGSGGNSPFVAGNVSGGTAVLTNNGAVTFDTTAGSISVGPGGGPLTIDNQGTITQTGPTGVELDQGDIVNEPGAVYDIQSDGTITGSIGTLTNEGTFEKSAGTGTSTVASAFVNDGGTIVAQAGTLALSPASSPTEALTFLSSSTFQPAAGTVIDLGAGTATLEGTWTGSGAGLVTASLGTLDVGASIQAGATLDFPAGLFRFVGSSGGSPGINGNEAGGTAVLTNLGFLTFDTTADSFDLGAVGGPLTFYNQGTISQTGPDGLVLGQANIVNEPGALYDIKSDGTVTADATGSDATLINMGTLLKSAGTGTATIQVLGNQGTVEVQSGTLGITTDSTNIAGNTLIGGTWDVSAGAALIFSSGADLATNDGNITLSGPGATFANVNNLATNEGRFTITSGRNFVTSGTLSNNGTVTVGPGSTLTIGGNYIQAASATLDLQLGGAPATNLFGQLQVQGSASLNGTLEAGLAGGYAPSVTDDFTVASYAAHTGNFTALQLPLTSAAGFQAAVGGTSVMLDASALIALSNVPANITVEATGPAGAVVTYTTPTLTDLVDPDPTLTTTPASGSTFPLGSTTVTISATDHSGNSTSAHFTIDVQDTTPPVLANVPASMTVEATGPAGAVATFTTPTATDLVDPNPTISATPSSGSTFPLGTTTVTVTASDHSGNTNSAHFTIDVQDTTPPVISSVPATITIEATGPAGAVATFTTPTATDLVDPNPTVTATPPSGSTFPLGTTTVTVTASDHSGNTNSAHFTIDVQDTTPPVISSVPATITIEATGPAGAVATFTTPTATDLVDPNPTISATPSSGSTFPLGTTTVTVTASDHSGNTNSAHFTIDVQDTTPPVISSVPATITIEATGPAGAVATFTTPTATDLVDPNPTVTATPPSGSTFPLGTTTVTVTATDHSGNTTSGHFTIDVQDTTPPVLANVPASMTVEATGPAGTVVTYTTPTATDLADPDPTLTTTPASGATFPLGTTTVTVTATDHSGNTTSGHFTIDVQDTTPPVLADVPAGVTVEATGAAGAVVTYTTPTATDLVDPNPTVTATPPGGSTFPLGTTTVTVTATDHSGNSTSAHFTIDVQDTTPPVLANVPASMTVEATGPAGAVATFTIPTATDLVDPNPTISATPSSGSTFPLGTTTVTVTATDHSGNTTSAHFTIDVQDTTPPVLANVPANITVTATGPSGAIVTYSNATATDLVDANPAVTATPPSGSTFPLGTTTVTVTAGDLSGNTTSATFTVTVLAPPPPPPQVTGIASVQSRKGLTSFIVVFNEPLDSASASNQGLYHVFAAVKKPGGRSSPGPWRSRTSAPIATRRRSRSAWPAPKRLSWR